VDKIVNFIEKNPAKVIVGLFVFHITIACIMSWIAYSPYFSFLHNGNGLWSFSKDSVKYHNEAVWLLKYLEAGDWSSWWFGIQDHQHVRWITLTYWLFGANLPILFEIFNSIVWVLSVLAVYFSVHILSNRNTLLACLAVSFLFFPSMVLTSTQLLRDPIYTCGMCFVILGWVAIYQENLRWKGAWAIIIGFFLIILMRGYMTPIIVTIFSMGAVALIIQEKSARKAALFMLVAISILSFKGSLNRMPSIQGDGFVSAESSKVTNKIRQIASVKFKLVSKKSVGEMVGKKSAGEMVGVVRADVVDGYYVVNTVEVITDMGVKKITNIYIDKVTGEIIGDIYDEKPEKTISILIDVLTEDSLEILLDKLKTEDNKIVFEDLFKELELALGNIESINNVDDIEPNIISKYLDRISQRVVERFDAMRWGFRNVNSKSGSSIDVDIRYFSVKDLIIYFPRAIQVSFLSPFPEHWISSGRETGKVGRLISGAETIVFYVVLLGFLFMLIRGRQLFKPLLPVLMFSTVVIVLLGYVVPNVGAIYRMRQGLLIPYYIVGIYGLYMLVGYIKHKKSHHE